MKRTLLMLLAVTTLAGCKAHMIETHGATLSVYNPNAPAGKGGVVRYLHKGLASMRDARRGDAEKQMKSFCGGDYAIKAEGPRSKFGAEMPIPKGGLEFDEWWYVAFDCR